MNKQAILGMPLRATSNQKIHIVGAGIAGLLLGYYLKKRGLSFTIYENSAQAGGKLTTQHTPYGIVEGAANGVMRCAELDELVETLGLTYLSPLPDNKKRYLVRGNVLRRFPLSVGEALKGVFNFIMPHAPAKPLLTLRDFADVYMSPTIATQLLEPALQGIYAASLDELGFEAIMPHWAKIQQNSGSMAWALLKNRFMPSYLNRNKIQTQAKKAKSGGTSSFEGGMQTLIDALAQYLDKHIQYNTDGIALLANTSEAVVLCAPAYSAAHYFEQHAIANLLRQVHYLPMLSATFFVPKAALTRFKNGFGCLIPRNEAYQIKGILFNHCIFEGRTTQSDCASLTCIASDATTSHWDNASLIAHLTKELEKLLGLNAVPLHVVLSRYKQGIPLYSPELPQIWVQLDELLRRDFAHIRLFGNYTGQISIRAMCQAAAAWQ